MAARRPAGLSGAACRHPSEYALASQVQHHGNVHLPQADLLPAIDSWPPPIFAPHRLDQTLGGVATSVLATVGLGGRAWRNSTVRPSAR